MPWSASAHGAQAPAGEAWLAGLSALVAELARDWSVVAGAQLTGGNESVVLAVVGAHGPAALKLVPPGTDVAASVRVLAAADGRGYARLYDLGVVVRDWCPWLLRAADPAAELAGWCRTLADRHPAAIWDCGYLERVSTGFYLLDLGAAGAAGPFLETAALLLTAGV